MDVLLNFKGPTRKAVNKMIAKNREKLIDLNGNVLELLFADKPEPSKVAKNFVAFLDPQPEEILQALYTDLNTMAEQKNADEYLEELMYELAEHTKWGDIHRRMIQNQQNVDRDLKKDWKSS